MNRTLYYRNLFIFIMFVAIIFVTPLVFAQNVTSPTLLRVDNANVQLRNRDNPTRTNTVLSEGSVLRLPNPIADNIVYDGDGNISMVETLRVWHSMAAEDPRLRPREVGGRMYYPIKILLASEDGYNLSGRDAIGYIAMADFLRPLSFNTVRADQSVIEESEEDATVPRIGKPKNEPPETSAPPAAPEAEVEVEYTTDSFPFFYTTEEEAAFDETTTPADEPAAPVSRFIPTHVPIPPTRPDDLNTAPPPPPAPAPVTERVTNPHSNFRCENIRGRVASALGMSVNSRAVNCYLDLFHAETHCQPSLPQPAGNAGNPYAAHGLCSIEASPAVRRRQGRGPECTNIQTVEQQTRCCAAMMGDTRGRYFGPVIRGEVSRCDLL